MAAINPYRTALVLNRPRPTYVKNTEDNERVAAYWTYDDIYNNVAEAFAALLREDEDPKSRRYIPFGKALIEATNRYLAKDLTWTVDLPADVATVSPEDTAVIMGWLDALFKREEFNSKFAESRREMLKRGDAVIQISADPSKAEGTRLRITQLDAAQYFIIEDAVDAERVIAAYVVTLHQSADGQVTVAQREEYRKILNEEMSAEFGTPIGNVFYKLGWYEQDGWDDRFPASAADLKPVGPPSWIPQTETLAAQMVGGALPAQITALPLYHFRNTRSANFGYSELQGLESILAGITQNTSDEDMAVALTGLGVYWTDSGSPKNTDGSDADWKISPASVMELDAGRKFDRVEGISSVTPMQDHINTLKALGQETSGTPDIAVGVVDVQVAESGVALAIKMAPVISKNREKETELANKLDQMMFDLLNGWGPAFEGLNAGGLVVTAHFGDPLPVDRAAVIADVKVLMEAKVVDGVWAREYLAAKLGLTFDDAIVSRMAAAEAATLDAVGGRLDDAAAAPVAGEDDV